MPIRVPLMSPLDFDTSTSPAMNQFSALARDLTVESSDNALHRDAFGWGFQGSLVVYPFQ